MSASREKKQRQSAGPSDKAARAQQEQAARRRKTVAYCVIAAVVVVLVAALLVWRSGFFQARAAAATIGDETLTTAELSYYYGDARYYYAYMGAYVGFDTSKADEDQIYNAEDNQTYRDYFLATALESARQDLALAAEAAAQGHTEDEIKDSLDSTIASVKSAAASNHLSYGAYLKAVYGDYMTAAAFEKLTARALMADLASGEKYTELFEGYGQADLDAYYEENRDTLDTIEYSYLYFPADTVSTKDDDGNDLPDDEVEKLEEEAMAEAKERAEEALAAYEGGATAASLAEEYTLGTSADHKKVVGTGSIESDLREHLLELDEGESELVETDEGYYVIAYHGRELADELTRDVRHIRVLADTTTDDDGHTVAPTDEAWAAAKEKIDSIKAEYDAGDKTEDAFSALAEQYSDDSSASNGGLASRIASGSSSYASEFLDWAFSSQRKAGDTTAEIVQHTAADSDSAQYWGYHLMFYVGENEPVWMGSARAALATADRQAWIDGLADEASYPTAQAGGAGYLGK